MQTCYPPIDEHDWVTTFFYNEWPNPHSQRVDSRYRQQFSERGSPFCHQAKFLSLGGPSVLIPEKRFLMQGWFDGDDLYYSPTHRFIGSLDIPDLSWLVRFNPTLRLDAGPLQLILDAWRHTAGTWWPVYGRMNNLPLDRWAFDESWICTDALQEREGQLFPLPQVVPAASFPEAFTPPVGPLGLPWPPAIDRWWDVSPPGPLAFDDFNRPDSASLGMTSDGLWTWALAPSSSAIGINGNRAKANAPSGGDPWHLAFLDVGESDVALTATIRTVGELFLNGFVGRYVDTANYWLLVLDMLGDEVELWKNVTGTLQKVAGFATPLTFLTDYQILWTFEGDELSFSIDGSPLTTVNDVALQTATSFGLRGRSSNVFWDDFQLDKLP